MRSPSFSRRISYLPRLRLGSISETPECESPFMNLGAESPSSILSPALSDAPSDDWARSGLAVNTAVPSRISAQAKSSSPLSSKFGERESETWSYFDVSGWRRSVTPLSRPKSIMKDAGDRDCGICFDPALKPARTKCCGDIFCHEHLSDVSPYSWLTGPASDGRCPSCGENCSLNTDTISLASPGLTSPKRAPTLTQKPRVSFKTEPPPRSAPPLDALLSSSNVAEEMGRLLSMAGLALVLLVLLSPS
ncbi:hypothetical protein PLICRDRAFT_265726 [Plicaturopsis crispa FD-325 SS-3]|nr:hypothetical protein PLICRDRAFT_265726 [Plicaturopsis crispa FD-325 SS-3]